MTLEVNETELLYSMQDLIIYHFTEYLKTEKNLIIYQLLTSEPVKKAIEKVVMDNADEVSVRIKAELMKIDVSYITRSPAFAEIIRDVISRDCGVLATIQEGDTNVYTD
jgi:hypothetical protein